MSADSLRVAIDKPSREMLGPAARYICVLNRSISIVLVAGCLKEPLGREA